MIGAATAQGPPSQTKPRPSKEATQHEGRKQRQGKSQCHVASTFYDLEVLEEVDVVRIKEE